MDEGLIVRLKPSGPWRYGSDTGARHEIGSLYRSDSVYSAVTHAMDRLGELEPWLRATAEADGPAAVCFSSCYPWQGKELYVLPPKNLWPPSSPAMLALRNARFVPLSVLGDLFQGKDLSDERWGVDAPSGCLVPRHRGGRAAGPYRQSVRSLAPVDRVLGVSGASRRIACIEFAKNAGLWLAVSFASPLARDRWAGIVESAFRLLADSGFGGGRSMGWGRSAQPEFRAGKLSAMLLPKPRRKQEPKPESGVKVSPQAEQAADVAPGSVTASVAAPSEQQKLAVERSVEPVSDKQQVEPAEKPAEDMAEAAEPAAVEMGVPDPVEAAGGQVDPAEKPAEPPVETAESEQPPESAERPAEDVDKAVVPEPVEVIAEQADSAEKPAKPPVVMAVNERPVESVEKPVEEVEEAVKPAAEVVVTEPVEVAAAQADPAENAVAAAGDPAAEETGNAAEPAAEQAMGHWLLSVYRPGSSDKVDWEKGWYSLRTRGGRVDSAAGAGEEKKLARMVEEGSVLVAGEPLSGSAANVAPEGFAHPVYRYGRPVSLPVPLGGSE